MLQANSLAIFSGFMSGVALSLTPCILPMIPIFSATLAGEQKLSRRKGLILSLCFVLGMFLVYSVFALIAAYSGAAFHKYFQSRLAIVGFAAVLVAMSLTMFGWVRFKFSIDWGRKLQSITGGIGGYSGAVILGATCSLVLSPCVTPALVSSLAVLIKNGDPLQAIALSASTSLGLGTPMLLLGIGLGKYIPKTGAWMVWVNKLIGLTLLFTAVWLVWPIIIGKE